MDECLTDAQMDGVVFGGENMFDRVNAEAHLAECERCRHRRERWLAEGRIESLLREARQDELTVDRQKDIDDATSLLKSILKEEPDGRTKAN